MGTTVGIFDKRAVRWMMPASSASGPGGPERTGTALPGVLDAVAQAERKQLSWSREDEQVGATSLGILTRYGWTGLHGVRWRGADDEAISHVAIGPGGVVVVNEMNWDGSVTVQDGVLRHGGFRCDREIERLVTSCATVTSLLAPEHRRSVTGVLCVTTRDLPAEPTGGVFVVGRLHLASMLVALPPVLSPLEVADITRDLTGRLLDVPPTLPLTERTKTLLSPLASEPSGYFVPRPMPGSPHAPAEAPAGRSAPTGPAPVVRVATPVWPGDEMVTPPVPPQIQVPVGRPAACWPGDEGPAAASPSKSEAEEAGWLSASAPPETWMQAGIPTTVVPLVRPATPGWTARPIGHTPDSHR